MPRPDPMPLELKEPAGRPGTAAAADRSSLRGEARCDLCGRLSGQRRSCRPGTNPIPYLGSFSLLTWNSGDALSHLYAKSLGKDGALREKDVATRALGDIGWGPPHATDFGTTVQRSPASSPRSSLEVPAAEGGCAASLSRWPHGPRPHAGGTASPRGSGSPGPDCT